MENFLLMFVLGLALLWLAASFLGEWGLLLMAVGVIAAIFAMLLRLSERLTAIEKRLEEQEAQKKE